MITEKEILQYFQMKIIRMPRFQPQRFRYAYPGSFDPWTKGHLSVVINFLSKNSEDCIDIIVAHNPDKQGVFTPEDRAFFIQKSIPAQFSSRVRISIVSGVVANYMYAQDIPYIIKGYRDSADFEAETRLAEINSQLFGSPMTLLMPQTESSLSIVSSSNLKMLANLGIRLDRYAPGSVREAVKLKTTGKMFIGVVGGIASGKSTFCKKLSANAKQGDIDIHHINLDDLGHIIYSETENVLPLYSKIRKQLVDIFGPSIQNPDGTINTKALGDIVFDDKALLDRLTNIMLEPILFLMAEKINRLGSGLILIESAILLDRNLSELVDENIVHVHVSPEEQIRRMMTVRNLSQEQAQKRLASQLTASDIQAYIDKQQKTDFGRLNLKIDSSVPVDIEETFARLEREYFARFNTRREGSLFIPEGLTFRDNNSFFRLITEKYNSAERHNHSLLHIEEMLTEFHRIKHLLKNPLEVYLAIIFHDIIYDIQSQSNEEDSVNFAREWLSSNLTTTDINIDCVVKLILLSKKYGNASLTQAELSEDEKIFLDMDMSIFGARLNRVLEYDEGVGKEYKSKYPVEVYNPERLKFLRSLQGQPLYLSGYYQNRLGEKATENLEQLIQALSEN